MGQVGSQEILLDSMGFTNNTVQEQDFKPHPPKLQLGALQVQNLALELGAAQTTQHVATIAAKDASRKKEAMRRLTAVRTHDSSLQIAALQKRDLAEDVRGGQGAKHTTKVAEADAAQREAAAQNTASYSGGELPSHFEPLILLARR